MLTPPPVSSDAYPTGVGSETRSNYLRGGLAFTTAYGNDVVGEVLANPVSDVSYSFFPSIELDKSVSRMHLFLTYAPGLTIFQRTSSENQVDQAALLNFEYRVSPHITFNARDSLQKTANVFNQSDSLSGGPVSGLPQVPVTGTLDLVADLLGNSANTELTYQFRRNAMVGVQGSYSILEYLQPTQVPGLYNSNSKSGQGFYAHRLTRRHYIGATYQYALTLAYPPNEHTKLETNTVFLFYTMFLGPRFTLSFSGGPQRYDISQTALPTYASWSPAVTASVGRQAAHSNFAFNYSRAVTGGGGLVGVFQSNSASATARWKLTRAWAIGAAAGYSIDKDVTPATYLSSEGGHRIIGTISVQHELTDHLRMEFGYNSAHQKYSGIQAISNNPNINRVSFSLSYNFLRPVGRG